MGAGHDALDQAVESLARETGAFDHAAALLRLGKARDRRIHMVVEGEQVDAAFRQPFHDLGFGVEIVGLLAQMEAGVGRKLRPHRLDRLQQPPRIVGAAQAGLPRPGGGVIDGGDAVADRLPVAVDKRHVDGKIDAGARHHLPLEGVAMEVDDTRQHQQAVGIDGERTAAMIRTDGDDLAACDPQRRVDNFVAEQRPAAFDQHSVTMRRLDA